MAKTKLTYVCQSCGHESPKWTGRCSICSQWNTVAEEVRTHKPAIAATKWAGGATQTPPVSLPEVVSGGEARVATGIGEIDRVLGGGMVPGSVILIGGDPGIGKSTILLQLAQAVSQYGLTTLYVSGEESLSQIKMRADRLKADAAEIMLLAETDIERISNFTSSLKPHLLIIDSIQTASDKRIESAPGSVAQVRECTAQLTTMAKTLGVACFIVGHVTKAGAIAGPRVLEHMVDTVLYFEGDRHHQFRIIRAVKNRFGSTNEIGVFEIRDAGLVEVTNPSALWLNSRGKGVPGSIVTCAVEGSRPILVEVQALVTSAGQSVPRRVTTGIDTNRAAIISAVLEKRTGLLLSGQDTYVSVVGGLSVDEPSSDLAVALALASSLRNTSAPQGLVVFGEVGLAGEVRGVSRASQRAHEAAKLGFEVCCMPKASLESLDGSEGLNVIGVDTVAEALDLVLGGK